MANNIGYKFFFVLHHPGDSVLINKKCLCILFFLAIQSLTFLWNCPDSFTINMPTSTSNWVLEENFHLCLKLIILSSRNWQVLPSFTPGCYCYFPLYCGTLYRLSALFYVFAPFKTLSVALSETFLYFALFESFLSSVSFAATSILNYFEKVPKNPLQAMSSAPKEEAGRDTYMSEDM